MSLHDWSSICLRSHFQLIFDSNSPFNCELGYTVIQTYHNSAQLLSVGSIDPDYLRRDARLTTAMSLVVPLITLELVLNKGVFCQGPVDPWNYAIGVASSLHAIYWILCTV